MSYDDEECVRPPHGWKCSRGNGHPGPCAARPAEDDDLIERCVHAARTASGSFLKYPDLYQDEYWDYVVRAALSQVDAAQPPAPISAEDVRAAEELWRAIRPISTERAAFVADYLNRRGERA